MPREKRSYVRTNLQMTPRQLSYVDRVQADQGHVNRAETLRFLIQRGITVEMQSHAVGSHMPEMLSLLEGLAKEAVENAVRP